MFVGDSWNISGWFLLNSYCLGKTASKLFKYLCYFYFHLFASWTSSMSWFALQTTTPPLITSPDHLPWSLRHFVIAYETSLKDVDCRFIDWLYTLHWERCYNLLNSVDPFLTEHTHTHSSLLYGERPQYDLVLWHVRLIACAHRSLQMYSDIQPICTVHYVPSWRVLLYEWTLPRIVAYMCCGMTR